MQHGRVAGALKVPLGAANRVKGDGETKIVDARYSAVQIQVKGDGGKSGCC